jgi:hypothetical protein
VEEVVVEFEWFPGFARSQAQKSIASLRKAAHEKGIGPVLEISSKSDTPLGVVLSAFNLTLQVQGRIVPVEAAFQGSKVFKSGGPFHDLYGVSSRDAKRDERVRSSGPIVGFNLFGEEWPTEPQTCFYDWLYVSALAQHADVAREIIKFNAFSDIAFNPKKSLNCQARSAAVFVALSRQALLSPAAKDRENFLALFAGKPKTGRRSWIQHDLLSDENSG